MTASFVGVLPVIHWPYGDACLDSMAPQLRDRALVADNVHGENIGVSRSWNRGIDNMERQDADWLVLVSAAVRFGAQGGLDFVASLDTPGLRVMEAKYLGWHLIGFHREVFARAGRFDTLLYPGHFNDLDFGWRVACAYGLTPPFWDKQPFDVTDMGWAHSTTLAGVVCDPDAMMAYLTRKWGSVPGRGPTWAHPFNDPSLPLSFQATSLGYGVVAST